MEIESFYHSQFNDRDTVLIIDDAEVNREILKLIFEGRYRTAEAADGREGLDQLKLLKDRICMILLDVVMPHMDGLEFMEHFSNMGLQNHIPVFLITSDGSDQVTRKAYEMGVMDVILKPIVPYVVKRRVDSVVELFCARSCLNMRVHEQQLQLLRQAEKIIELNKGIIEALATSIEFRSGESGDHVNRIHDITEMLLRETSMGAGLTSEEITQIALAAIMHDIGKIAIPDAILNKPGRLTSEEYEIMKQHTVYGCQMLEKIPQMKKSEGFQYAYDIARHHHERWDGKGYPDGLKGDEISIWSQIVSLADVYDALVSKRVYKDAYGFEEALDMIRAGQCGVFNPKLLEVFLEKEKDIRMIYD